MSSPRLVAIAVVTAAATILAGWWSVALVGVLAGMVLPPRRATTLGAAGGAALGWAAILAVSSVTGPIWAVAQRVGPVFSLPAWAFVAVTLVFPALLAGSAALVVGELRQWTGLAWTDGSRSARQ